MSPTLSTWSRILLIVLGALCVLDVVAIGFGAVLVAIDATTDADGWDGVGTALGLVLAGFALILLGLQLGLLLLLRSARSLPDLRRLNRAARLSAVLAVTTLVLVLWLGVGQVFGLLVLAVLALPAVVLAVPAIGTLLALRTEVRAQSA